MSEPVVLTTYFEGLKIRNRGKVRDIYDLGDALLMVATDRISAFDVVLPSGIPFKGKVLTQMSAYWLQVLEGIIPHHLISIDTGDFPSVCQRYKEHLRGRSMLVKKASPLPVECVVRGYLAGSGWSEYQQSGTVCGIPLKAGLEESSLLPEPLFTPATKAETGAHDENISMERMGAIVGGEVALHLKQASLSLYARGSSLARERGIIIADTKFEFGWYQGTLLLIDEVLTPDSSRFWPQDDYAPGRPQKSFDKQFVRDYLLSLNWDKKQPAPPLPEDIVRKTSEKYLEAFRKLTGRELG